MIDKLLVDLLQEHINRQHPSIMKDWAWEFARISGYKPEILWIVKPKQNKTSNITNPDKIYKEIVKYKVCMNIGPKSEIQGDIFRFLSINVYVSGRTTVYDCSSEIFSRGNDPEYWTFFTNEVNPMTIRAA